MRDAEGGDAEAMASLADKYRYGDGVEADLQQARSWYEKAGEAGYGL
jgi:TPR repeat protein